MNNPVEDEQTSEVEGKKWWPDLDVYLNLVTFLSKFRILENWKKNNEHLPLSKSTNSFIVNCIKRLKIKFSKVPVGIKSTSSNRLF